MAVLYANDKEKLIKAKQHFLKNAAIGPEMPEAGPLIKDILL